MKIAIITPSLDYGGGEKQVELLALGLKQRGHSVVVYCFSGDGEIADFLSSKEIKIIKLYSGLLKNLCTIKKTPWVKSGIFRKRGKIALRATRLISEIFSALRLLSNFLKNKPEVVHLYQNQTKMGILVSKLCGVKRIIYTETSIIGDWFTPAQLFLMKRFWKFCDAIMVLSVAMKDHMMKLNLIDRNKIHLIPTMVSVLNLDTCLKKNSNDVQIRIGVVGRLRPEKGHLFFLKAAKLVLQRFPNYDISFIIAGDGYLKDELIRMSEELGVAERVKFLGEFRNIEDIMNQIDIFVLSSLTESVPIVLIEAMAYGKPIVSTDVGEARRLIKNGENGFIVPTGDAPAMAEAINKLIDNVQMRQEFANSTVRLFNDIYSPEKIIPQIEALYCNQI